MVDEPVWTGQPWDAALAQATDEAGDAGSADAGPSRELHRRKLTSSPEVTRLVADGWQLLHHDQQAMYPCWSPDHRCYGLDPVPRHVTGTTLDGTPFTRSWSEQDERRYAEDEADFFTQYGTSAPPPHQLWFVRSPWPGISVDDTLGVIHYRALATHPDKPVAGLTAATTATMALPADVVLGEAAAPRDRQFRSRSEWTVHTT